MSKVSQNPRLSLNLPNNLPFFETMSSLTSDDRSTVTSEEAIDTGASSCIEVAGKKAPKK
jgi:hypothetical protein